MKRTGIVLSGGAARGIAHLGVLQVLEENGIFPEYVSGCSMGAIVGALYAAGIKPSRIYEIFRKKKNRGIFGFNLLKRGLTNMKILENILKENIEENSFNTLHRKFYISTVNLNKGNYEIISKGELFQWVMASSAIPVIFEPRIINGNTYVDGGLMNNMPVEPLLELDCFIIGVHVNYINHVNTIDGVKDIADRCFRLSIWENVKKRIEACHYLFEPKKAHEYGLFEFEKMDELYETGYEEASEKVGMLKEILEG
ncbi:MAG: patatin-like phospholipase family protein [bacterium]